MREACQRRVHPRPCAHRDDRRRWLAAAAGAIASAVAARAGAQPAPAVELQRVSEHAWFVQGMAALGTRENRNFISNAGAVVTPAGVVLIDALGSPALARDLLAAIARVTREPVTHVVVTHYHADHVYGLAELRRAGAQVIAHAAGREYLGSETAPLRLRTSIDEGLAEPGTTLVAADRWLEADTTLDLGGVRLRLVHVGPAHTAEDLAVMVEPDGVLFAGDLVFRGRVPFVGTADSRRWIDSLERLIALGPRLIVPGHGPASADARADLQLTRDYLAYLRETMGRAAREMQPFDDAYTATDWSRFESLPLFRMANRMNAYNTYLLMEQQRD